MDRVFRALADATRRGLLDSLRARDGQTLGELCAGLDMARQSATQHLTVLEEAHLISTVRRGREKLHYLNPVPIHEIRRRWIAAFDEPRLAALEAIKERSMIPDYVYVTYIRSTAERVWSALTDADLTARYWGHSNRSDWQPGSTWEHVRTDGSGIADGGGVVIKTDPPRQLVISFGMPGDRPEDGAGTVTFDVEPWQEIVRLTVTHTGLTSEEDLGLISKGWPAVLANLKSLLETGDVLPQAPWEM
ncbi:ArsR/SmtB family transcription factor [Catenuloplanes sp. NPDC051500]|uniref:ArsR/SmtB family transcription factor n=1 Tax=Catenuloplanes sp. NPDC051500 TaxID=3363959 RepID=UPI0037A6C28B